MPIHSIAGGKLPTRSDLNGIQKSQRKRLTVVADEMIRRPLRAHVVDDRFASLPDGFVVERRRPDLKRPPLGPFKNLIDVNDVQILVLHPKTLARAQHLPVAHNTKSLKLTIHSSCP